jgi:glycolate oxidase iron-sulfur subunit
MTVDLPVLPAATYAKFNTCVHCGLCLPTCPTYVQTLDEADSPRGRIHLMKAAVDGRVGVSPIVFEHLDRCLVCRACETACPSGVEYHDLLAVVRPQVAAAVLGRHKHVRSGMVQFAVRHVLPYPKRMAAALAPLRLARQAGLAGMADRWMPGVRELAEAAAAGHAAGPNDLPTYTPATGVRRGRVIFLRGCVGSVVSASVNTASVRVLARHGFDVHILPEEPCCGALAAHANDPAAERQFARQVVESLRGRKVDFIVSAIAGCAAQLKALGKVLEAEEVLAREGRELAATVRDISELLVETGVQPMTKPIPRTVTYHDPCHLAHAQRITSAPRRLLALVPGLRVAPLEECDMCCGGAGPYSLNQPEMSRQLGQRKVQAIAAAGVQEVITANVGCILQLTRYLRTAHPAMRVRHIVEVLAEAYGCSEGGL